MNKKNIFIYLIVFLFGLIIVYSYFQNPNSKLNETIEKSLSPTISQDESECIKSDGEWMMEPLKKEYFCNKKYKDADKPCKDSSDCLSNQCIKYKDSNNSICAPFETIFGCYSLIKRGESINNICAD